MGNSLGQDLEVKGWKLELSFKELCLHATQLSRLLNRVFLIFGGTEDVGTDRKEKLQAAISKFHKQFMSDAEKVRSRCADIRKELEPRPKADKDKSAIDGRLSQLLQYINVQLVHLDNHTEFLRTKIEKATLLESGKSVSHLDITIQRLRKSLQYDHECVAMFSESISDTDPRAGSTQNRPKPTAKPQKKKVPSLATASRHTVAPLNASSTIPAYSPALIEEALSGAEDLRDEVVNDVDCCLSCCCETIEEVEQVL